MNKYARGMNVTVLTCARDASEMGGGIASAVLPLHLGLYTKNTQARLLSGFPAVGVVLGQRCLMSSGQGFTSLAGELTLPAVVHVHGLWTPFEWRACAYARRTGVPLVMSPHGMLEPWALRHKRLKKCLAWQLYQRRWLAKADLIVVNSWNEYRTVRNLGLKPPVAVIENGVDIGSFDLATARIDKSKSVLFLSRLSPVKGVLDLLEAWSRLPSGHGYVLRLCGPADPGYAEQIEATIKRLALEESVRLIGPVFGAEKWQYYKNADVFVLPSYSENFGIVVAESLLAGVPVITTRATPWECLEVERLGWLVENDPGQLAGTLLAAMQLSDAEREEMGLRAAAYARAHFLWPDITDKYAETYAWITGGRAQRPAWVCEE